MSTTCKIKACLPTVLQAIVTVVVSACVFVGCSCGSGGGNQPKSKQAAVVSNSENTNLRSFPAITPPTMISNQKEALDFVVEHFWDKFTDKSFNGYCDDSHVNGVTMEELEKQYGTYAMLLWQTEVTKASASVARLFALAEACEKRDTSSNVFEKITELTEKYFHDPNSPLRNEEFYLPYVSGLAESDMVPAEKKPAYSFDAKMCALNRIGTQVADFSFTEFSGKKNTLYSIKADYLLLFFSNPGCPSCKDITEVIESDDNILGMMSSGRLKVVNMYIDQELDKWREYAAGYPTEWISGYDHNYIIRTDVTYNIRAIPSLYLLDSEKRVLLKDAPLERVEMYLRAI